MVTGALRGHPVAVVCDLDGTLVDSTAAMSHALRVGCAAVGVELAPGADLAWCVGPRIEESLRALVGSGRMIEARRAFRDEYRRSAPAMTPAMPSVRRALGRMKDAGVRLGVATYKPEPLAQVILDATRLFPFFSVLRGRRLDVEDERPKAAILADAIGALGATPAECVYVGDHAEDASAAQSVGTAFLLYGPLDWSGIAAAVLAASPGGTP